MSLSSFLVNMGILSKMRLVFVPAAGVNGCTLLNWTNGDRTLKGLVAAQGMRAKSLFSSFF